MASQDSNNIALSPDVIDAQRKRRQKLRSIAIAVALFGVVIMFYLVTIIRMGGNVGQRTL